MLLVPTLAHIFLVNLHACLSLSLVSAMSQVRSNCLELNCIVPRHGQIDQVVHQSMGRGLLAFKRRTGNKATIIGNTLHLYPQPTLGTPQVQYIFRNRTHMGHKVLPKIANDPTVICCMSKFSRHPYRQCLTRHLSGAASYALSHGWSL